MGPEWVQESRAPCPFRRGPYGHEEGPWGEHPTTRALLAGVPLNVRIMNQPPKRPGDAEYRVAEKEWKQCGLIAGCWI